MPINKITHVCLTHDKVRARNEKMLEDAKNGMSQEQLAEKYQICVSTVRYSLKDFYEEQARQRKAKKKAWQTQMIHEYEMGAKSPELQEKYGISGTLFYRILHAHGKNGRQIHSQNRIETGKKRNAEMVRKYKKRRFCQRACGRIRAQKGKCISRHEAV